MKIEEDTKHAMVIIDGLNIYGFIDEAIWQTAMGEFYEREPAE